MDLNVEITGGTPMRFRVRIWTDNCYTLLFDSHPNAPVGIDFPYHWVHITYDSHIGVGAGNHWTETNNSSNLTVYEEASWTAST